MRVRDQGLGIRYQELPSGSPRLLTTGNRLLVILPIITLIALALRVWGLDSYGLWYDEVASIEIARRGPLAVLTDRFGGMLVQTPLHYLMVWVTSLPLDPANSPVLVRLPSVIAGALTPVVVYGIGKEMFGRAQGLLAALFIALSAVHIGYSQDARPYALLTLTTALSVYTLLRAERERLPRWWAAFALATVAALYISYFSLTLFMPALLPYLGWVIYRQVFRRNMVPASANYSLLALAGIAVAAIPIALDVHMVQRNPPNLGLLLDTPRLLLDQGVLLVTQTARLGLGGVGETSAQWGLFALSVVGALAAPRSRRSGALLLSLSLMLIPSLLLSIAKTTNPVFQRYAVFVMPFYFLLIANGIMRFWILDFRFWTRERRDGEGRGSYNQYRIRKLNSRLAILLGTSVALLLIAGVAVYSSREGHRRFSYLPDYRGAARYLFGVAGPGDLIIMADEPALGMEVVSFYWNGAPPAPTFDARDPRLFSQTPKGTIFWVVSLFQNNPDFIRNLHTYEPAWSDPAYFERIIIMRDHRQNAIQGMENLAGLAQLEVPEFQQFQPVSTLQGVLYQARGQSVEAAALYKLAGAYFPQLGAEFFSSAQGFAERGDSEKAWREAITSKFMQPGNPDLHAWLSERLLAADYPIESRVEAEIAEELRK